MLLTHKWIQGIAIKTKRAISSYMYNSSSSRIYLSATNSMYIKHV